MKISIKSSPEDFKVEEIISLSPQKTGRYGLYYLTKSGWNTVDAIRLLANELNLKTSMFAYAGKKDRHALTGQYITIEDNRVLSIKHDAISIKHLGYVDEPIKATDIKANRFTVNVRGLKQDLYPAVLAEFNALTHQGFVNYFDDQRFGGFDKQEGFLAERIIKEHYNHAVKILVTNVHPQDKSDTKKRKRAFIDNWRQWEVCLELSETPVEKRIFQALINNPKAYIEILKDIPHEDLSMAYSAYQSFIWNEHVRRLIIKKCPQYQASRGVIGDYIFLNKPSKDIAEYLKNLKLPTIGVGMQFPDGLNQTIAQSILKAREVTTAMFKQPLFKQAFLKTFMRDVIVKPRELSFEKHPEYLRLSFVLPRGSYATMLIKRITAYV